MKMSDWSRQAGVVFLAREPQTAQKSEKLAALRSALSRALQGERTPQAQGSQLWSTCLLGRPLLPVLV